jgi:predicted metal-dependent hydrolase
MVERAMEEKGKFLRGVALFNAADYFESHEVWEELWLAASGEERVFLQGLIQVAAALHHHGRGNLLGMRSLLAAGLTKLDGIPDVYRGIDVARLREDAREWVGREPSLENLPQIAIREDEGRKGSGVS